METLSANFRRDSGVFTRILLRFLAKTPNWSKAFLADLRSKGIDFPFSIGASDCLAKLDRY